MKLRGYRIELGEIEALLRQHPGVREAVVVLREDEPGDRRLVAYVVPAWQQRATAQLSMRRYLQAQLPDYMLPRPTCSLEALPLSPNGKLDRGHCQPLSRRQEAGRLVAPRNALEELLAAIWAEVLGVEQVGSRGQFLRARRPFPAGHPGRRAAARGPAQQRCHCGLSLKAPLLLNWPQSLNRLRRPDGAIDSIPACLSRVRPTCRSPLPSSGSGSSINSSPSNPFYNISASFHLQAALHLLALQQSLNELAATSRDLAHLLGLVDGTPPGRRFSTSLSLSVLVALDQLPASQQAERLRTPDPSRGAPPL